MSGLVTAIYDVGCAFGAVSAFLFGERIGRKRSIIYANIIGKTSDDYYEVNPDVYSHNWGYNPGRLLLIRSDVSWTDSYPSGPMLTFPGSLLELLLELVSASALLPYPSCSQKPCQLIIEALSSWFNPP